MGSLQLASGTYSAAGEAVYHHLNQRKTEFERVMIGSN